MFDETVVILAGGLGSRLGEYTEKIPKPLVKIGNMPIISHIMGLWHTAGFRNFVIAGGYKVEKIKKYFADYTEFGDTIKVVDTGVDTGSAGRLKKLEPHLTDNFFVSYGDVLTSFPLSVLRGYAEFYKQAGRVVTMQVAHPVGRFGEIEFLDNGIVTQFSEKPVSDRWINAGFFGMNKKIFEYIYSDDDELSEDVLPRLVVHQKLVALPTYGEWSFWHSMDTPKDVTELNKMWDTGDAPWKIW